MQRFSEIREMICYYADKDPSGNALMYEQEGCVLSVSYSELLTTIDSRAAELRSSGKKTVGVLSDGSLECILEIFSALTAGMRIVMLDENLDDETLQQLILYTDIDSLWGDEELVSELEP